VEERESGVGIDCMVIYYFFSKPFEVQLILKQQNGQVVSGLA
jgi:hypothetical protein